MPLRSIMKTTMEDNLTQVDLLHRISRIVSSERSMDEMLGEVIGLTSQVTGCDACLVYLLDEANGELVLRASQLPHARDTDARGKDTRGARPRCRPR